MAAKKIILSRQVFLQLYDQILQKMERDYGQTLSQERAGYSGSSKSSAFFGYGADYAPDKPLGKGINSVAEVMSRHPDVLEYLGQVAVGQTKKINFGWFLYKKYGEAQTVAQVTFSGVAYTGAYFRFLGFADLEAFEHSLASTKESAPVPAAHSAGSATWTHYIGSYYSFVSYRVKKFHLAVQFARNKNGRFPAKAWGFHVSETRTRPSEKPVQSIELTGEATISSRHLYINLQGDPRDPRGRDIQMHLIGICEARGGQDIENQMIVNCSVQTVSLRGYVVNLEAVLVQTTPEHAEQFRNNGLEYTGSGITPALDTDQEQALHLYLMLQRRNFWIRDQEIHDLTRLKVKGNLVRNYIGRLRGTWRLWNFGLERGKVIQSKLQIGGQVDGVDSPYATHFYPFVKSDILKRRPTLAEQVVALSVIRDEQGERLCFATYLKDEHLSLANYAIFDLLSLEQKGYAEGMFVSCGYNGKGVIGGYAVMCLEKEGRPVDSLEMPSDQAKEFAQELGLTEMHEGLREIWRRKLWRRKLWEKMPPPDSIEGHQ